jgi:hypothetical protein
LSFVDPDPKADMRACAQAPGFIAIARNHSDADAVPLTGKVGTSLQTAGIARFRNISRQPSIVAGVVLAIANGLVQLEPRQ